MVGCGIFLITVAAVAAAATAAAGRGSGSSFFARCLVARDAVRGIS